MNETTKRDLKILMRDLNAKVETDSKDRERFMGRHGIGERNEKGKIFTEFCSFKDLLVGGAVFPHKTKWISPDGKTEIQNDHITIHRKVKRGADATSDYHLVVAFLRTELKAYNDRAGRPSHRHNTRKRKECVNNRDMETDHRENNWETRSARH
uniref:Uncharacterized protein n=1 Tax=Octopus bimaculoides TaxID=37653 RepID=A0A0L8I2S6_OCTBM